MASDFAGLGKLQPDLAAFQVCSTANIDLMSTRRIRLTQLRRSLESSVFEIERAGKWDDVLSRALLTANLVRATCEAFLEMAGALGEAAGIKGAQATAKVGIAGMAVAGSTSSMMAGTPTDWVSTTSKLAGAVIETRMDPGMGKYLAELQTIKVDTLNAAVRGDSAGALQGIFLNYLPKLGEMSFHYMKKETALKWTGAVAAVSSAGYSYSRALEEAFNTRISDVEEFSDRKSSLLATTHRQIGQIKQKIDEIDAIMRACGAALSKGQIA